MSTIRSLSKCIILITYLVSLSSFTIFDGSDETLSPPQRPDPGLIRKQAILRKLRSSDDDFAKTNQTEENDQDDGQTTILLGKKSVHFYGVLGSGFPEEILRSIRSSLIPRNPYAGLPLRYLTMINGK